MARLSKVVANEKKKKLVEKYRSVRSELRAKSLDESVSEEERYDARRKLEKLPRNTSATRVRNRCVITGRSQGYLRRFGLSRIKFRELAHRGMLPGVTKSSW